MIFKYNLIKHKLLNKNNYYQFVNYLTITGYIISRFILNLGSKIGFDCNIIRMLD